MGRKYKISIGNRLNDMFLKISNFFSFGLDGHTLNVDTWYDNNVHKTTIFKAKPKHCCSAAPPGEVLETRGQRPQDR